MPENIEERTEGYLFKWLSSSNARVCVTALSSGLACLPFDMKMLNSISFLLLMRNGVFIPLGDRLDVCWMSLNKSGGKNRGAFCLKRKRNKYDSVLLKDKLSCRETGRLRTTSGFEFSSRNFQTFR